MARIWIVGAGDFGLEVEGWLNSRGVMVSGFIDDSIAGSEIDSYQREGDDEVILAIADPVQRQEVWGRLADRAVFHGMHFHTAPPQVSIAGGCVLCPTSLVSRDAVIQEFCHVNVFSSVGHHVSLAPFCTLSSHVDLCGDVTVGERTFFGSGARVLPGVTIGKDCVIGAGAIVGRNVPDGMTIYAEFGRSLYARTDTRA